jgi:hypothetical protein
MSKVEAVQNWLKSLIGFFGTNRVLPASMFNIIEFWLNFSLSMLKKGVLLYGDQHRKRLSNNSSLL